MSNTASEPTLAQRLTNVQTKLRNARKRQREVVVLNRQWTEKLMRSIATALERGAALEAARAPVDEPLLRRMNPQSVQEALDLVENVELQNRQGVPHLPLTVALCNAFRRALERGAAAERALNLAMTPDEPFALIVCGRNRHWRYFGKDGGEFDGPTPLDAYLASPDATASLDAKEQR